MNHGVATRDEPLEGDDSPRLGEVRETAFGRLFGRPNSPGFQDPIQMPPHLGDELPDQVLDLIYQYRDLLAEANQHLARQEGAARTILTHAFNDAQLLIMQVYEGDGRSAARTARSIFEHYVNYLWVTNNVVEAERYAAGRHVTAHRLGHLRDWWLGLLDGEQRASEKRRLDQLLADAEAPMRSAKHKFDTPKRPFENAILSQNLYGRAKQAGLQGEYDAYRVLSGVVHGDAGGAIGLTFSREGWWIHRVGADLQLVPLAHLYGFRWLADFFLNVAAETRYPSVERLSRYFATVGAQFPIILATVQKMDAEIWPQRPPRQPVALLALHGSEVKDSRWYLFDPGYAAVTVADPDPDCSGAVQELLRDFGPPAQRNAYPPLIVVAEGVTVRPRPRARPAPVGVLPPEDLWVVAERKPTAER